MATNDAARRYSEQNIHECICGGKMGYVRIPVAIDHILFGQAVPCWCQRDRAGRERIEKVRRDSALSLVQEIKWNFATFDVGRIKPLRETDDIGAVRYEVNGIISALKTFAVEPGGWIILQGTYGCGKTHLAYAVALEAIRNGAKVYVNTVADMLEDMKGSFESYASDSRLAFFKTVDVLVLDDFGAQRDTPWAMDVLFQVINYRYANRLPMVITTNLDITNPDCGIEERVRSRLLEGTQAGVRGFTRYFTLPLGDVRARIEATV